MNALMTDLRFAVRMLFRDPGFAIIAVLTLALGIGANTAIFSVVYNVLLRSLPYEEPARLVRMHGYNTATGPDATSAMSLTNFMDLREEAESFEAMAAYNEWGVTLTSNGEAERLEGADVTWEFFHLLGVKPAAGRFFLPEEDRPGSASAVVIDHGLWVRRFGSDPEIVGRNLVLNDTPYTVVGVTGPTFEDPELSNFDQPALWRVSPSSFDTSGISRRSRQFTAIGRLAPGVDPARAQAELDTIMDRLAREYPDEVTNRRVRLVPLAEQITAGVRPTLLVLHAAVGIVLLIACVNVMNLLLARGAARGRELAVRASLGATRRRLIRQFMTEGVVLGVLGGTLGLLLAWQVTGTIMGLAGSELPRTARIAINLPVLAFTAAVSLLAGLLSGLVPVLRLAVVEPRAGLAQGIRAGSRSRLEKGLVIPEIALSVMLLVGAGLLMRSLWTLQSVDPGFDPSGVLAVELAPAELHYPEHPEIDALHRALHERIGALPGVDSVASVSILPMGDNYIGYGFLLEDRPAPAAGETPSASIRTATPGYFRTLGIPLVRGRGFSPSDGSDSPPVIVITESMARKYWPGANPIGKRLTMRDRSWEIVGIAGDIRHSALGEPPAPSMYVPFAQSPSDWMNRNAALVIRSGTEPVSLAALVRATVRQIDPKIPVLSLRPMEAVVGATILSERFRTLLLALFAAAALVLSAAGVYGVVSVSVVRRTREIGVRMAMGASASRVLRLMLREVGTMTLIGTVVGGGAALMLGPLLRNQLFGISAHDPLTLIIAPATVIAFALLACLLPARRAARIQPTEALRYE